MPNATLNLEFPEYKIRAIEQALKDKGIEKTVPDLLREHMDGMYSKYVPSQAQKYLDNLLGDNQQEQSQPEQESDAPVRRQGRPRQPRQTRQQEASGQSELETQMSPAQELEQEQTQQMRVV